MRYQLTPEKGINIPDETIKKYQEFFDMDEQDAIQLFLEEEGYAENNELEKLEKKAENIQPVKARKSAPKKEVDRKSKDKNENTPKKRIMNSLIEVLNSVGENIEIINPEKLVQFDFEGLRYEIDLKKKNIKK